MKSGIGMSKQERIEQIQRYLCGQFNFPPEQVGEMLPSFLTTLASHMNNIESALKTSDLLMLGKAGHKMKGALLNLGLQDCAQIAMEIEEKGKSGDASVDFEALVADLRQNLDVLVC